jgi:tetraacyldisaccharide 4'-kinase
MKAPTFWQVGQGGISAVLLTPVSCVWRAAAALKKAFGATPWRAPVPVICIGNVTAGGAGKTPVALDIAARLIANGAKTHFLTRGYGGQLQGPVSVNPNNHSASDVGDEALLLARTAPTWAGSDRAASAHLAVAAGAEVLIMDDGFQNFTLSKDLSLLVFDGGYGIGNGRVIPAGPLREPLAHALARAHGMVIIGDDQMGVFESVSSSLPKLSAHIRPNTKSTDLAAGKYLAFAGIGRPEKFFKTLRDADVDVVATTGFADHHFFSAADLSALRAQAEAAGARLITTEKDWLRLDQSDRDGIDVLTVNIEWQDEGAIDRLLTPLIESLKVSHAD